MDVTRQFWQSNEDLVGPGREEAAVRTLPKDLERMSEFHFAVQYRARCEDVTVNKTSPRNPTVYSQISLGRQPHTPQIPSTSRC